METPLGRLRIGQLARAVGVDPPTIRTWESRYGVPAPDRTDGGHRLYPSGEVEKVTAMRRLIEAGYRASEAARTVSGAAEGSSAGAPPISREHLTALLTEGDLASLEILDRVAARMSLENVIADVVSPVMREVGERWASGAISVAEEHAASALVSSWLGSHLRSMPPPLRPGPIAMATPRGERHELGLTMASIFLRRQGVPVLYLGADVPADDLVDMVHERDVRAVCLAVSTEHGRDGLEDAVAALGEAAPEVPVAVGGALMDSIKPPAPAERLPSDYRVATSALLDLVA
ncbi:MAG: MerR family transcriptional regulator [Actinomycetota bacterium]|nr:MerR family transcriptional regulator [Actinomycetota bacterium]